jgi:hypothetical protein
MFKLWSFDFEGQLVAVFYADFSREKENEMALGWSYKSQAIKTTSMKDHMFLSFVISHLSTETKPY